MNSSPIVARPVVYIVLGWALVVLSGFIFVMILCFPPAPQPQYPDAMTPLQALICFPGSLSLVGGLLLWMGYRVVVVADEDGLRWKRRRVWRRLRWDEVAKWAILYDESSRSPRGMVIGRDGQQIMWDKDWSNLAPLAEFIARKLGSYDSIWPDRFVYGGEHWLEKGGQMLGVFFCLIPVPVLVRTLWVDWATTWAPLPHHWIVVVLVLILVVSLLWLGVSMARVLVARHRIEAHHKGESVEVRKDELIWKDSRQTWNAPLKEVRLFRERNGDWRFQMPQGSFVVERFVGWRLVLQALLEERAPHLHFSDGEESSRFGFDTRVNRVLSGFALFFAMATAGASRLSDVVVPNSDGVHGTLNLWQVILYGGIPTIGSLFGFYTCKRMAYEVSDEGLWRQGLWKSQWMNWGDVTAVRVDRNGGSVEGVVDGRSVRWTLSTFLTVERPHILRKLVVERASHAVTRES